MILAERIFSQNPIHSRAVSDAYFRKLDHSVPGSGVGRAHFRKQAREHGPQMKEKTPRSTAHKDFQISQFQSTERPQGCSKLAGSLWLRVAGIGNSTRLLCEGEFVNLVCVTVCIFSQPSHLRAAYIFSLA